MRKLSLAATAFRPAWALVFSTLIPLTASCSGVVAGAAHPTPNLKPRPLTGVTIQEVMLSDTELSRSFGQKFRIGEPVRFGGPPELLWGWLGTAQSDCSGLSHILIGEVYTNAQVVNVTHEQWTDDVTAEQQLPTVLDLDEGVVALPTMGAADALFSKFRAQWSRCGGARIESGIGYHDEVGEVHADASTVEATVTVVDPDTRLRRSRAVGVRNNCIVEVAVTYFLETAPAPGHSASDVARQMLNKIGDHA